VALLLSVAGLSAATVLTSQAYDRERQQRTKAEENFRQVWKAVDQFAQIGAEDLAGDPSLERARRLVLETALAFYQDFIDQRRDDPSLKKEFEDSRDKINLILDELTTGNWVDRYFFLRRPEVQHELKLDNDQWNQINDLDWKWLQTIRHSRDLDPRERDRQRAALVHDQEADVAVVLSADQQRRFKQIALQLSGPSAFSDPDVAETLKLTADQKKKVREIQSAANFEGRRGGPPGGGRGGGPGDKRGGLFEGGKGKGGPKGKGGGKGKGGPDDWHDGSKGGRRGPPEWMDDWRPVQDKKIQSLLTPEQQQRWQELIGPAFGGGGPPGPPHD
jgi:hypothetical protein